MQGPLTLGNIVSYINSQLSADGFSTRFQKTQKGGTTTSNTSATYGLQITPGANESISLSAAATPALYLVGNSGLGHRNQHRPPARPAAPRPRPRPPIRAGRLTKIVGHFTARPAAVFSVQPAGHHRHHHGRGHGGRFQRQRLCHRQRHRQFRQPDQPGQPGRLSHQIRFRRQCDVAEAAGQRRQRQSAMAWRSIRPAAWSSPAARPPISPPPRSPTATTIPLSPAMTPAATRPGSSRSRPWPPTRPMPSASMPAAISISAAAFRAA